MIDSLSTEYDPWLGSGDQLIGQMKTQIGPEYNDIHKLLDSISMIPVTSPVLNKQECEVADRIQKTLSCQAFYTWCGQHVYTDCWGGGFLWLPRPGLLSALPEKIKAETPFSMDVVPSGFGNYDILLNHDPFLQVIEGIAKIDTIFSSPGLIPLIFDVNVHAFKYQGKTHQTDTIYLEVLPAQ